MKDAVRNEHPREEDVEGLQWSNLVAGAISMGLLAKSVKDLESEVREHGFTFRAQVATGTIITSWIGASLFAASALPGGHE